MESGRPGKDAGRTSLEAPAAANRRRLLRGSVIATAVLAALVSWFVTRDNSGGSPKAEPSEGGASSVVTVAGLRDASAALGQPIYWAGPISGRELRLRELGEGGGVQVVYTPDGTEGRARPRSLTIGSYPLPDPSGALDSVARRSGSIIRHAADGQKVVTSAGSPTSVYFASPDNRVQVEVYDPSPARAMSLALSGRIRPVE